MLLRRLTIASAAVVVLTACAGADGTDSGAIREDVIEPGLEAIDESQAVACSAEASNFRTVLEVYEVSEGEPAPDEAALVEGGYMRSESELWDVVDGELVAQHSDCADVPTTVPAAEIVTESGDGEALTVDDVMATFTDADVDSFGGADCARQLAVVFAGASQYVAAEGVEPSTMADVEAAGYFDEPVTMWEVVDDTIRPTDGSGCLDFVAAAVAEDLEASTDATSTTDCDTLRRTMEVAIEAFLAQTGELPATETDLVTSGMLRAEFDEFDLGDDGTVVAVPGGRCA